MDVWQQQAAIAQIDLGLSLRQFGAMSPRYFHALCERRKEVRRHEDYMMAQIAAMVINFSANGTKKWFQPRDLMPGESRAERSESTAEKHRRFREVLRGLVG